MSVSDNLDLSTEERSVTITKDNLVQASAVLDWIYSKLPKVYARLGNTRWGEDASNVYAYIKRNGGQIDWGKLSRVFSRKLSASELKVVISTFTSNGVMSAHEGNKWTVGSIIKIEKEWS